MAQPSLQPLLRLKCGANNYAWGKKGSDSLAARFAAMSEPEDYKIDEDKPYSELWMGTHPSLPAAEFDSGKPLLDILAEGDNASTMLSQRNVDRYGKQLPFLFKVLSINQALSIQAHPNKTLAQQLHARDPANYPDANHKPEMAIALTEFDGLCGFRPLAEIAHFLRAVPAFRALVGDEAAAAFENGITTGAHEDPATNKTLLRNAFSALMNSTPDAVVAATAELIAHIRDNKIGLENPASDGSVSGPQMADLVLRLNRQYPDDIGLFNLFFLNYVKMGPGEAMFLQADDIHAYLSGNIIECMAASDNVVRAGFTPKFKDVDTLTSMLTYGYAPIADQKMTPADWPFATFNAAAYSSNSSCILYNPPIPEFAVIRSTLAAPVAEARTMPTLRLAAFNGPSVVICTSGIGAAIGTWAGAEAEGVPIGIVPGTVLFVPAGAEVKYVREKSAGGDDLVLYQAVCVEELSSGGSVAAVMG